jgi:hypothetical protein
LAVLAVVVLFLATSGFTALPWNRPSGSPPGSSPGGGAGGGGDDDENTSILAAGTTWALGTHQYRAVWFNATEYSGVWGNARASGAVYYFLVATPVFESWAGGNGTAGTAGNLTKLAALSNWSRESPVNVSMNEQLLGPGAFDFVAADAGATQTVEMTITSPIYEEPFDTS